MNAVSLSVLVVEDCEDDAELLRLALTKGGYAVHMVVVDRQEALRAALAEGGWQLIVSDHNLRGFNSLAVLEIVRAVDRNVPVIVVSGAIGEELAVEVMQGGADDFIMKGRMARLLPAVERGLREARIRSERREALRRVEESEARLKMFTANVPCLVVQIVRDADGRLTVPYAEGRLRGLLGLREEGEVTAEALFAPFGEDAGRFLGPLSAAEASQLELSAGVAASGGRRWLDFRAGRRFGAGGESVVWEGVFFDISERKRVETEILDLNQRLRELAARVNSGREEERARIASELHDDLGGSLTALKIDLVMLRGRPEGTAETAGLLGAMAGRVDEIVAAVRRICADLHPKILDELGLAEALRWQCERFAERSGLACDCGGDGELPRLPRGMDIALFRVYQELLTNVVRHAQATRVVARLNRGPEGLELEVEDDGVGINPERAARRDAFGLFNIQQRVREIGGRVDFAARPEGGTRVRVRVPLSYASLPGEAQVGRVPGSGVNQKEEEATADLR